MDEPFRGEGKLVEERPAEPTVTGVDLKDACLNTQTVPAFAICFGVLIGEDDGTHRV
jgi:hypothetical protein